MNFPPPTPFQARVIWGALTALAVAVVLALSGLLIWALGWVLGKLSAVLLPVAIALILAYIIDPVVEFFVRHKVPRLWSIVLVFTLGLALVAALLGSVVPGLVRETRKLIAELPENARRLQIKIENLSERNFMGRQLSSYLPGAPTTKSQMTSAATNQFPAAVEGGIGDTNAAAPVVFSGAANNPSVQADADELNRALDAPLREAIYPGLTRALHFVLKWVMAQLGKFTTWVEFLVGFVLVPVYLFYFLLEKHGINQGWTAYLPIKESKAKQEIIFILQALNDCMIVFFRGQVLVALCVGTLLASGYRGMGLNYAVLLGVVAAVLGVVPYLGTVTSLALALTVATIQFEDWKHPLLVLAIAAVVKLCEDFLIGPKIIGERSGLHPLTIILAVIIGVTLLGGVLGALLAIPLTAVLRTLMFRYVWKRPASADH
jgi:predicted PurR-regulated permease PerM